SSAAAAGPTTSPSVRAGTAPPWLPRSPHSSVAVVSSNHRPASQPWGTWGVSIHRNRLPPRSRTSPSARGGRGGRAAWSVPDSNVPRTPTASSARGAASSHWSRAPDSSASQWPKLTHRSRSGGMTLATAAATSGKIRRRPVWNSSASSPATRNWLKVNPPAISSVNVDSRYTPSAISSTRVSVDVTMAGDANAAAPRTGAVGSDAAGLHVEHVAGAAEAGGHRPAGGGGGVGEVGGVDGDHRDAVATGAAAGGHHARELPDLDRLLSHRVPPSPPETFTVTTRLSSMSAGELPHLSGSLVAEGFDGGELGGTVGRVGAEEDADHGRDHERYDDRPGGDHRAERADPHLGETDPDGHAEGAADEGQEDGLDQELGEDVAALGAEGLADADLPRPLGHGHQHDVHDADAADEEGDGGHRRQEQREDQRRRLAGVEQAGLVEDLEVERLAGLELVRLAQ